MKSKIIMIGGFHETIELYQKTNIIIKGIVDFNNSEAKYFNIPYLGDDSFFIESDITKYPLSIISDKPLIRKKLFNLYFIQNKYKYFNFISKGVEISKTATLGKHYSIMYGTHISSKVVIGDGVRINCNANIMHDCIIGDFSTIAPNAVLLGNVKIGEEVYIGANSTILPNIKIGNNSIVGAGSVVTHDVPKNSIYCGNPARFLRAI